MSQMLRKSVETRDWVTTIEPRNVRAVMKRVVEDITSVDVQVSRRFYCPVLLILVRCNDFLVLCGPPKTTLVDMYTLL